MPVQNTVGAPGLAGNGAAGVAQQWPKRPDSGNPGTSPLLARPELMAEIDAFAASPGGGVRRGRPRRR
jgi:hypothetical protein